MTSEELIKIERRVNNGQLGYNDVSNLIAEVFRRGDLCKEGQNILKESVETIERVNDFLKQTNERLKSAEDALKFYADPYTWDRDKFLCMSENGRDDAEEHPRSRFLPGMKARAHFDKYKEKLK